MDHQATELSDMTIALAAGLCPQRRVLITLQRCVCMTGKKSQCEVKLE
jgi:hypothetical protein